MRFAVIQIEYTLKESTHVCALKRELMQKSCGTGPLHTYVEACSTSTGVRKVLD